VNGRRLDFDYKRRRSGKVPAEEMRHTWDKFMTSKELAERSMFVLLLNDVSLKQLKHRKVIIIHITPYSAVKHISLHTQLQNQHFMG